VLLLNDIKPETLTYNKVWFNDYVFAGDNLYTYFAVEENPIFIGLIMSLSEDPNMVSELEELYQNCKFDIENYITKGQNNVPLI
jgi:hypothetical protein